MPRFSTSVKSSYVLTGFAIAIAFSVMGAFATIVHADDYNLGGGWDYGPDGTDYNLGGGWDYGPDGTDYNLGGGWDYGPDGTDYNLGGGWDYGTNYLDDVPANYLDDVPVNYLDDVPANYLDDVGLQYSQECGCYEQYILEEGVMYTERSSGSSGFSQFASASMPSF